MKSYLLDTNVVLSYVLDREPVQQEQATRWFEAAARGEALLILPQPVLTEIVYVLRSFYKRPAEEIQDLLASLLSWRGIETYDPIRWSRVLEIWPAPCRDLTDAMVATTAETLRCDGVVTFDRDFAAHLTRLGLVVL